LRLVILTTMTSWLSPPSNLTLTDSEIHVWKADLNCERTDLQQLFALLTPDEQQKAARFHFEKDRNHYGAARGLLRLILSSYLSEEPKDLRFTYNLYGKPALDSDLLQFNVSHSHGLALYAVARHCQVGIDLEYMRTDFGWRQIVEQYFSPQELKALTQLPESQQYRAFFDGWTRKEAFIKAKGKGLSIPLNQFDVSLSPVEPAALLHTQWDSQETAQWTLHAIDPGEDYAGAIAIRGRDLQLHYWQASPQFWQP
jgi:4'-phosphopantetheinyl transferase